jgi:hypothetical protein
MDLDPEPDATIALKFYQKSPIQHFLEKKIYLFKVQNSFK